jgi:hypothetical protein
MPNAESDKRAVKRLLVDVGCKNPPPIPFTLEQVLSLEAASIGGGVSLQSSLLLKRLVDAGSSPTQRL